MTEKLSRKGQVRRLHDKEGPEAAWTLGLKLKLKPGTLHTWFSAWRRDTTIIDEVAKLGVKWASLKALGESEGETAPVDAIEPAVT